MALRPGAVRLRRFRKVRHAAVKAGIVARGAIARGGVVHSWAGSRILPRPTYKSVQVGIRSHAHDPVCLNFLNHSCDPNVHIDIPRRAVVALRDIRPGELLTIFYPATEWDMARPFRCRCGSRRCLRWIRGARHTPRRRLRNVRLARHIRVMLARPQYPRGRRPARAGRRPGPHRRRLRRSLPSNRRVV